MENLSGCYEMRLCLGSDYEVYSLLDKVEKNGFTVKRGAEAYYFEVFDYGRKIYAAYARDEFRQQYTIRFDPEYFGSMKLH